MKTAAKTALVALALAAGAVAPAAATPYGQLAAAAGLSPAEAEGLTLNQIAAHLFNRGESTQDRQAVRGEIAASSAGPAALGQLRASARNVPGESLPEIAAINFNRGQSGSDRITVRAPIPGMGADRSQLAASAGLGIDGAEGASLTALATALANRGVSDADKMTVRY
jgi:hypothetical protein